MIKSSHDSRSHEKYTTLAESLQLFPHLKISLSNLSHDSRSHDKYTTSVDSLQLFPQVKLCSIYVCDDR